MTPAEQSKYLNNIADDFGKLPALGTYGTAAEIAAAQRGFSEGVRLGYSEAHTRFMALRAATTGLMVAGPAGAAAASRATISLTRAAGQLASRIPVPVPDLGAGGVGVGLIPRANAGAGGAIKSAAEGVTSVPLLARGPGGKMLGEALNILKVTAPEQQGKLAAELLRQVEARATGGAWSATEMPAANGARVFSGEFHSLVVDSAGNVFKGPNAGLTPGLINGKVGIVAWPGLTPAF